MIGNGISILDLTQLAKAVKDKQLTLQIKVLEGEWADLDRDQFRKMVQAITTGEVSSTADIRARLYKKT